MSIVLNRVAKASQCLCNTISAANADPENIPVPAKAPSSTTERMFFKRIGTPFPNIQFQRMTLYQLRPEINTVFKVGQVLIAPISERLGLLSGLQLAVQKCHQIGRAH